MLQEATSTELINFLIPYISDIFCQEDSDFFKFNSEIESNLSQFLKNSQQNILFIFKTDKIEVSSTISSLNSCVIFLQKKTFPLLTHHLYSQLIIIPIEPTQLTTFIQSLSKNLLTPLVKSSGINKISFSFQVCYSKSHEEQIKCNGNTKENGLDNEEKTDSNDKCQILIWFLNVFFLIGMVSSIILPFFFQKKMKSREFEQVIILPMVFLLGWNFTLYNEKVGNFYLRHFDFSKLLNLFHNCTSNN